MEENNCFIQFRYIHETSPGEEIHITGNIPSLGNWSIEKSEKMFTSNQEYPLWKSKENIFAKQNSEIQYKYLIFKNGKFLKWEKTDNNQNLRVKTENYYRIIVNDPGGKIDKHNQAIPISVPSTPTREDNEEFDKINDSNFYNNERNETNLFQDLNLNYEEYDSQLYPELNYENSSNNNNYLDINMNNDNNFIINEKTEIIEDESEKEDINEDINNNENEDNEDYNKILLSYYLPLEIHYNDNNKVYELKETNESILYNIYCVLKNEKKIKWMGILKNYDKLDKEKLQNFMDILKKDYNMFVIDIPYELYKQTTILMKNYIEPFIHYININFIDFDYDFFYDIYVKFNSLITEKLLTLISGKTLIFINNISYLLVPSFLTEKYYCNNNNKINNEKNLLSLGLFINTPCPSFDIFRKFPHRSQFIESMLKCNVIGFHTFDSNRNFLNICKNLLDIEYKSTLKGDIILSYLSKKTLIRVNNITPDQSNIKEIMNSEEFKTIYKEIKKNFENKLIYSSINNTYSISTLKQQIIGFKKFIEPLEENKREKIVYLQYIKTSDETFLQKNDNELKEIQNLVDEINKENKNNKIIYLYIKDISYSERIAILSSTSCIINSAKRGNFSLSVYEFLLTKLNLNDNNVEYILSELSSVISTLGYAIKVNPFDSYSICNGLEKSFDNLCTEEKNKDNKENDYKAISKSSCYNWINSFYNDIKNNIFFQKQFYNKINFDELKKSLLNKENRIFFINDKLLLNSLSIFNKIAENPKNKIFLISSLNDEKINKIYSQYNNLNMVSENGFSIKYVNQEFNKISFVRNVKEIFESILKNFKIYNENCQDSVLEINKNNIKIIYEKGDNELDNLYNKAIIKDMEFDLIKSNFIKVKKGKNYLEVYNKNVNRGNFCAFLLKDMLNKGKGNFPDFILVIGNKEDEDIFKYLYSKENIIRNYSENIQIFTINIGEYYKSKAKYFYKNVDDFNDLIDFFLKESQSK